MNVVLVLNFAACEARNKLIRNKTFTTDFLYLLSPGMLSYATVCHTSRTATEYFQQGEREWEQEVWHQITHEMDGSVHSLGQGRTGNMRPGDPARATWWLKTGISWHTTT